MNIEIKKNNKKLNKIKKNSVIFKTYFDKYFKNIKNKKDVIPLNVRYIEIKNLDKFNYSKNYYNHSSNILYLLSYLNTINFIPNNMRIICHSNIMNNLLKHIINNDIKKVENIKNENLWSLFMNLKHSMKYDSKINITRHGFSVANLYKEVQKKYFIKNGVYEKDAKLSMYGIFSSLLHGDILVSNEKEMGLTSEPNIIYVSTLIRTWMTAICLYLPQFAKKEENSNFTLIISPFIKEECSINFIKTDDNEPEKFDIQIKNILYFLHYLLNIYNNYNIKNSSDEIIKKNLEYIYKYFESENELIIMKGNIKYTIKCIKNEINRYLFKNSSNSDKNNFIAYYHKLEHNSLKETVKNNSQNNRNSNATTTESLNSKNSEIKTYIIGNIYIFEGINKPFKEESNLKFPKESKDIIISCEAFSKNFDSKESEYSCENFIYE